MHRFGINFHRDKRSKGTFKNSLEEIRGIGTTTANQLLKTFRSVNNIRQQTEEDLAKVVGSAKARLIKGFFESDESQA